MLNNIGNTMNIQTKRLMPIATIVGISLGCCAVFIANANAAPQGPAVYTANQATQGSGVYAGQCASCHGTNLEGSIGPALSGSSFEQMAAAQQLTAASLLAVITQTMPKTNPGSLAATDYANITAYILQQNNFTAGQTPLSANSPQLQALALGKSPSTSQ
jgi:mono/diheme cytochrome c family protein